MEQNVDDFLAHYGVLGMRWGQRKRSMAAVGKPKKKDFQNEVDYEKARDKARRARSKFRGNEMIKEAGSARKAKRSIVVRAIGKQILYNAGAVTVGMTAKSPATMQGAAFALNIASWGSAINDINRYQDVRRAAGEKR